MSMAVVAGGDIRGDGRFAKGHRLAMIGIAIMFQSVLMAFAAAGITGHFEVSVARGFDFVSGMAVRAHRPAFVAFSQQLTMNALVVSLFDADMALAASFCHSLFVDRRIAIHPALDLMHAMAVVTGWRDNHPHL